MFSHGYSLIIPNHDTYLSTRYSRSPQTKPLATVLTLGVRMAWVTWKDPCLFLSFNVVSRNYENVKRIRNLYKGNEYGKCVCMVMQE